MTPDSCGGAELNIFLRSPLLLSGSRTLREANATVEVESLFYSISPAPRSLPPCLLFNSLVI